MPEPQEWKSKANEQYQKVVSTIITLSTASLVLPVLFLKNFIALPKDKPMLPELTFWVFLSWGFLGIAVVFGVTFYYASAKWLKQAYGGSVSLSEGALECILDLVFWAMIVSFLLGLGSIIYFVVSYAPKT